MTAKAEASPRQSIMDYALAGRLKDCSVCRLPEEARMQVVSVRKKRIDRETVLGYLREVWDWDGDDDEYTAHVNAHHDKKLRELQSS